MAPKLTEDDWKQIRACWEHGVEDSELVGDYFGGHDPLKARAMIRQKRARDKRAGDPWLSPSSIAAVLQKGGGGQKPSVTGRSQKPLPRAEETLAKRLLELRERNLSRLANMVDRSIRHVSDGTLPIESMGDAKTALQILDSVAGVDKGSKGGGITLNLGAFYNPTEKPVAARVLDV